MLTALEGPGGSGPRSSLSQALSVASASNLNSLNAAAVYGVPSWRASWWVPSACPTRCSGPRPCSPGRWDRHLVLCPSSLWLSYSGLVLFPKEWGRGWGSHRPKGTRGERWAVGHLSPQTFRLGAQLRARGQLFLPQGTAQGTGYLLIHVESHS